MLETDLVYIDGPYTYELYTRDTELAMHLIPPHKFGPPERCYYEQETEYPGYIRHRFGKGQAISLPWSPGALFHRQGHTNTANFLADLLQGIAGLEPAGGNLPPMVEVTRFGQADGQSELLHLVNASGHFGNSFYASLPLENLEMIISCVQPPATVEGLRSGQALEHTWSGGRLAIRIPRLELFEAIKLSYLK